MDIEEQMARATLANRKRRPPAERFWEKVGPLNDIGCWVWLAGRNRGYGTFWDGTVAVPAHRFAYEQARGRVPEGLELDHLCRNPACVRPIHLEAVTHKENVLRGVGIGVVNAAKTHCAQGHEYNKQNTQWSVGRRHCRICTRLIKRRRRMA